MNKRAASAAVVLLLVVIFSAPCLADGKKPRVSSPTGWRINPITGKPQYHLGVDYPAPINTPALAIYDGKITYMGWFRGWGKVVRISHHNGLSSQYGHLNGYVRNMRVGDIVKQGQIVGFVGSTGQSTGPHLDLRIYDDKTYFNPLTMTRIEKVGKPVGLKSAGSAKRQKKNDVWQVGGIGSMTNGEVNISWNESESVWK